MSITRPDLDHALRRAEQEAVAAIRAPTPAGSRAHEVLSLLHAARVRTLLTTPGLGRGSGPAFGPDEMQASIP